MEPPDAAAKLDAATELPTPAGPEFTILYSIEQGLQRIVIWSPHLVQAFKAVNKYPILPCIDANGPFVSETEPFPNLFRNLDEIKQEVNKLGNSSAELDFEALAFICHECMGQRWKDADEEKYEAGMVSYSTLWNLFKVGDLVIRKDSLGNEWLYMLVRISENRPPQRRHWEGEGKATSSEFVTWRLSWNEEKRQLQRTVVTFSVNEFLERRKITSLPIYPVEHRAKGKDGFVKEAAETGRKWYDLITGSTSCYTYHGTALRLDQSSSSRRRRGYRDRDPSREKLKVSERVIIDDNAKCAEVASGLAPDESDKRGDSRGVTELDDRPEYQWDELVVSSGAELTEMQALLCPRAVACFDIATCDCYFASVSEVQNVEWNGEAIRRLVLDKEKRKLLRGLVEHNSDRTRRNEGGDIIENKGKGLVILLYGPPGVGKTLTAECVAEHVKKPLIALSMGDLIEDEMSLERRLLEEFERAVNWDAVLLLDEADVVLEARSFEDVRRNAIVSIFLRQLEYYKGVLILTTNRISTMDVAFQSRIQVALEFPDLTREARPHIWKELLESRQTQIGAESLEKMLKAVEVDANDPDMKRTDSLARHALNGRQIRNVLNVAEGYAFSKHGKPGMVQLADVKTAAEAALEFQKLFERARSQVKSQRSVWAPYQGGSDSN